MQFTLYHIPLLLSSLFSTIIIILLQKRKKTLATTFLTLFMCSIFIWSISDFFDLLSTNLSTKIFWNNVSYFGVATFSFFLTLFVLEYIGKGELVNRFNVTLLSLVPIITIILVWTNNYHHLMRQSIFIENISSIVALGKVYGTWFWVQLVYAHCTVFISTVLIFYALSLTLNIYKKQGIIFLIGIFVPWIANFFYVFSIISVPIDMTSVSFAVTGLVLFWGITREHLLDIVPTAYMAVFNEIPESVIILGGINQVVGMNPSAEKIFNIKMSDIQGMKFQDITKWKGLNQVFNDHLSDDNYDGTFSQNHKYYDIYIKSIYDKNHVFMGKLIVMHDISERRKMEEQLIISNKQIDELNDTLQIVNKILRHDLLNKFAIMKSNLELYKEKQDNIFLENLDNSIGSGIELIDRLRELESFIINKGRLKSVSIKSIVEKVSKNLSVPVEIKGDSKAMADEALFSVFENIMRNAIIHGKTDRIRVEIKSKNKISEIRISDVGEGIPQIIKDKIFEEGISYGENKGSGLGLFIAKRTIERYGGEIKLEDNKPRGAIFVIKLRLE